MTDQRPRRKTNETKLADGTFVGTTAFTRLEHVDPVELTAEDIQQMSRFHGKTISAEKAQDLVGTETRPAFEIRTSEDGVKELHELDGTIQVRKIAVPISEYHFADPHVVDPAPDEAPTAMTKWERRRHMLRLYLPARWRGTTDTPQDFRERERWLNGE